MKVLLIFAMFIFSTSIFSQELSVDSVSSSKVISDVSYFWKLDSLGNNGYRLCVYKQIVDSEIDQDKISRGFLVSKLGRPNKVWTTNKGIEWIYYVLDGKKLSSEFGGTLDVCVYISFLFDKYEKFLLSKSSGVLDY